MKTTWKTAAGVTLMLAVSAAWAAGGLKGTKHDFTGSATSVYQWVDQSTTPATVTTYNSGVANCLAAGQTGLGTPGAGGVCPANTTQATSSIGSIGLCTKCHTPHKAKSTNLLWNHTLLSTQYSWDDAKTTAGTPYPTFQGDTYKGPTTKCLSCHDGTMASTDGMWFNRQTVTGKPYVAAPGTLDSGHEIADRATANNMSGNHPVAFPYPLNGVSNVYNGVANGAGIVAADWVADPSSGNNIMLYNQAGGTTGAIVRGKAAGITGMECGSCHDVHNGSRVPAGAAMLLTGQLTGNTQASGYICLQCHIK
jgi:hypothetical protein